MSLSAHKILKISFFTCKISKKLFQASKIKIFPSAFKNTKDCRPCIY